MRESDLITRLQEHIRPINAVNPTGSSQDMCSVAETVGDARVVGLGEATHGTREFTRIRHRITQHLVQKLDFRNVGIEADWSGCLAINDVVVDGVGSPAAALAGQGYWMWQTDEMLAFITWLREHNATLPREQRVRFFGIDAARADFATNVLSSSLERVGAPAELCAGDDVDMLCAMNPWTPPEVGDGDRVENLIADIKAWLVARDPGPDNHAGGASLWRAMQSTIVLGQIASRRTAPNPASHYSIRDRAMAMNIERVLDRAGRDAKAVIWAHNSHITRDNRGLFDKGIATMGEALSGRYHSGYLPVGFTFGCGSFLAYSGADSASPQLETIAIDSPPANSLDRVLMTVSDAPSLLLNLGTTDEPLREWLSSHLVTRWAGAGFTTSSDMETRIVPTAGYDALIHVNQSTPTHLLRSARLPH